MSKVENIQARLAEIHAEMEQIAALGDSMSQDDVDRCNVLNAKFNAEELNLKAAQSEDRERLHKRVSNDPRYAEEMAKLDDGSASHLLGRHGAVSFAMADKFADSYGRCTDTASGFGEFIRASCHGIDGHTPRSVSDIVATQTSTPDSSGGVLVPEIISSMFIDEARSRMVLTEAGVTMMGIDSESYVVPQVVTSPTFAAVAEAGLIGKSDIVFDSLTLVPKKYAGIVEASNELVESGIMFAERCQSVMAASLADVVDSAVINGDGTGANMTGLLNQVDISKTSLAGPLTREAVDAAIQRVSESNHTANAVLLSPANWHQISLQQASTAGTWLGAPPSSDGVVYLPTTSVPDTHCIVGDFSLYLIGWRTQLRFETSRVGDGTAWSNDLTSFRAVSRLDAGPLDASAFEIIDSIT